MSITQVNNPQSHTKTLNFRLKYKTEKCRYLLQKGYCPFSQHCTFAHYDHEIRFKTDVPTNYKTKTCINFFSKGYCSYGQRCQYLHSIILAEDGRETRSSSEESNSSKNSLKSRNEKKLWDNISHNKRVQLIQSLGLDISIRSSSRLMQLLKNNQKQSDYSTDEETQFENYEESSRKQKKYSM